MLYMYFQHINNLLHTLADSGFFEGGWLVSWSSIIKGACPKMTQRQFDNWNLLKTIISEILTMPQSKDYDEAPVLNVFL